MAQSGWASVHKVYKDLGITGVFATGLKKILRPVARVGSLYFLERDLGLPMPRLEPNSNVVAREGTLSDIHLLDQLSDADRRKDQAIERLRRGDHWFIGVDRASGKLMNHRWVTRTRSFIPELARDIIVNPGQGYIYDMETVPEFRRQGIEAVMRQFTYQ